jgi:ABC-type molybdate transport system ATPase subunit
VVSGTGKALLTAADRIVVLRDGTVEATGTLPELLDTAEFSLLWKPPAGGQ